ncbi:unnamed protein product [Acanthoscelides obtectus]|uniref:Uncharacterized protein n=1 Tax=Acanthoscelides obtectus TaxID=200917 RepID=A0A9P0LWK5_ACAOB|nr:unnamed protein product [Acanthoscelides obtectus]CAK1652751.1 hypothetical protein AOBTE_LOCUS17905 [Acanthoscelides obtectus]
MIGHMRDHVAVNLSTESLLENKKRTKSLRRQWNELSRCQKSIFCTIAFILFTFLYVLCRGETKITPNLHEISADTLKNIGNDPREAEQGFNEVVNENQVLEEPAGVEVVNSGQKDQVLGPPRVEPKFTGEIERFLSQITVISVVCVEIYMNVKNLILQQ